MGRGDSERGERGREGPRGGAGAGGVVRPGGRAPHSACLPRPPPQPRAPRGFPSPVPPLFSPASPPSRPVSVFFHLPAALLTSEKTDN